MRLTLTSDGKIHNDGQPILLRGGHCHLFSSVTGDRAVEHNGASFEGVTYGANENGCPGNRPQTGLSIVSWDRGTTAALAPALFLDRLAAAGCNLVRVFLSNGVELAKPNDQLSVTTRHPFTRAGGKWRIAEAVQGGPDSPGWSKDYFETITRFVRAADQRGIAVQLCLFSYHDFTAKFDGPTFKYWGMSFWRADQAQNAQWGASNLLPADPPGNQATADAVAAELNRLFLDVANQPLMDAQKAYVEKVLAAVGTAGNVILELMNEPRTGRDNDQVHMATWLNRVTGWITGRLGSTAQRPLLAVNASFSHGLPSQPAGDPKSDVDIWKDRRSTLRGYDDIALITYHGLTGVKETASLCGPAAAQTDRQALNARIQRHEDPVNGHAAKALMLSTDAVRFGTQTFSQPTIKLDRRDGYVRRIQPKFGVALPTAKEELTRFDLGNWAYHTVKAGLDGALGTVHFQNHSTFERSFELIGDAYREATGQVAGARLTFEGRYAPPVTGGANHQNFWWAHRHLEANLELVNQFRTENGPSSAPTMAGRSEIGWRYELTGGYGPTRISAAYDLRSVSEIEDPQATVGQRLRLVVSIPVPGHPDRELDFDERPIQRGQKGPGRLEVQATLAPGVVYRVTVSTRIDIAYQDRTKVGYGETIVRFSAPGLL